MKRFLALTMLVVGTAACSAGSSDDTPDALPQPTAGPATVAPETSVAPETTEVVTEDTRFRTIALPPPSGDPELDALGAELDGLQEELAALDSAADPQGNP